MNGPKVVTHGVKCGILFSESLVTDPIHTLLSFILSSLTRAHGVSILLSSGFTIACRCGCAQAEAIEAYQHSFSSLPGLSQLPSTQDKSEMLLVPVCCCIGPH